MFQAWPYLNSLIIKKLPFSQQEHVQTPSHFPRQAKHAPPPPDPAPRRDQKNIPHYQRDAENHTDQDQSPNPLPLDRHIHMESPCPQFRPAYLCYKFI